MKEEKVFWLAKRKFEKESKSLDLALVNTNGAGV
jgi:hypothetical protein